MQYFIERFWRQYFLKCFVRNLYNVGGPVRNQDDQDEVGCEGGCCRVRKVIILIIRTLSCGHDQIQY
jgi:hypothetical protein